MAVQSTWIKNIDGSAWDAGTCPNSCRILYPAAASAADLIDTFESFITSISTYGTRGWELIGDLAAPTNTLSSGTMAIELTGAAVGNKCTTIAGVTASNSLNGVLYWDYAYSNPTGTFRLYKDAGKTQEVAIATCATPTIQTEYTISQSNASGITGVFVINANPTVASFGYITHLTSLSRCYRAACKPDVNNAVGYKYIEVVYGAAGYLNIKVYESSGLYGFKYLANNSNTTTYAPRVTTAAGGSLYIACKPEYLMVQGGVYNSGCFELERANTQEDTVAYGIPNYIWVNSYIVLDVAVNTYNGMSKPRNRADLRGNKADQGSQGCLWWSTFFGSCPKSSLTAYISQDYAYPLSYPNLWSGKTLVSDITVGGQPSTTATTYYEVTGRILGLKLACIGLLMDEIAIKIDSNGFVDPSGTATTHIIFLSTTGKLALPK